MNAQICNKLYNSLVFASLGFFFSFGCGLVFGSITYGIVVGIGVAFGSAFVGASLLFIVGSFVLTNAFEPMFSAVEEVEETVVVAPPTPESPPVAEPALPEAEEPDVIPLNADPSFEYPAETDEPTEEKPTEVNKSSVVDEIPETTTETSENSSNDEDDDFMESVKTND